MISGKPTYDINTLPGSPSQRKQQKYMIVIADWNADITHYMAQDAQNTLLKCGIEKVNIHTKHVPGAVELVYAANKYSSTYSTFHLKKKYAAIIVIGCIIKGDTPHFDYVCQSVTQGITLLNSTNNVPIIFSVLTTLNKQQAIDRINGTVEKKGKQAAIDAIWMANINENF